jgi:mercuric ion transport protein
MNSFKNPGRSMIAATISGIGASACCVLPLVLLTLGVSGTWISTFTVLEPFRPLFIGLTVVFLGWAFRRLYLVPQACAPGEECVKPATLRNQHIAFWAITVVLLALIAFPWYAPLFLA